MNREKELLGMALWVEKHHGADGPAFILEQIERLAGDTDGQQLWRRVGERFKELQPPVPIYGQPETWPN